MSTAELLVQLKKLQIRLRIEGGELRVLAPKNTLSKDLLARIRDAKSDIVATLQSLKTDASTLDGDVVKGLTKSSFKPASYSQMRLWFLDRLEPDSPFYSGPAALRIEGHGSLTPICESIGEIVRR